MSIYILIASIIFLLSVISSFGNIKSTHKSYCIILIEFILIFLSGLRDGVGTDYDMYKKMFMGIRCADDVEPGFKNIVDLCLYLHIPADLSIFTLSLITILLASKFIKSYSPLVFLSFLIFFCFGQFYFNTFNAVRQNIVTYWFLSSLYIIRDKKFFKYFVTVLLMSYFIHLTALYLIVLYFICQYNVNKKMKLGAVFLFFIFGNIIIKLVELSPYAIYLKFGDFAQTHITSLQFLMFIFSAYLILKPVSFSDEKYNRIFDNLNLVNCCLLATMFAVDGSPVVLILTRLLYYTTPIYIVLIPCMVNQCHVKTNKEIITIGIGVMFIAIMVSSLIINGVSYDMIPYESILF